MCLFYRKGQVRTSYDFFTAWKRIFLSLTNTNLVFYFPFAELKNESSYHFADLPTVVIGQPT